MFSSFYVLILVLIIWYLQYKWKRHRLIEIINKLDGPPVLPILGNALQFSGNPKDIIQEALKVTQQYPSGNPFRIWILNKPYVVLTNAEDFQIAAGKALEKDQNYSFIVDMLGDGIFTSKVNKWRTHRQLLKSAFNPIILSDFFLDVFNNQNRKLIQQLEKQTNNKEYFDLWPYIISTSINSISETAIGREEEYSELRILQFGQAVLKSAEIVSQRFCRPWLHLPVIFAVYKYLKGYQNIFKIVHEYPLEILDTKKKKLLEGKMNGFCSPVESKAISYFDKLQISKYLYFNHFEILEKLTKSFIGILLDSQDKQLLTDQEIKDEVISVMFGGSETTSVTNCFLLLILAIRQDIQIKVYEEIFEVFGNSDRPPTMEDLSKLNYLEQCIKETLRRFPVVPAVFRHATEDIVLSGKQIIPAGANIILPILLIHHDPNIYPNPLEWNPSNYDSDRVKKRHSCTFVPFSTGPRGCIGQKYAYVSMKAQISTILRHFKLSTNTKMEDIDFNVDMIIRSAGGYPVKLEWRHGK